MNSRTIVLLLSGCLLFSSGCMQDHDRDNDNQKSGIAPADADKSSQAASKTNAPDSGLGHISGNGQNDAGGSFGGIR